MMQFDPSSGWIWRRWTGTIFAETWTSCVRNMAWAMIIYFAHRAYPHVLNSHLAGFGTLWGQLLSITTFTLTFFVNQSYSLWRKCMELSRRLQGRLHDIGMNMATHAERKVPSNPSEKATYTSSSRQILELMSRYVRVFNLLTYASFTRSHRPILTPRGMRRLVERGLMTAQEREVLVDAGIPATQRHSVVLMWMIRLFIEGRASGHIQGGAGFESETMHKFHIIRSQYGAIGDELQGRMPLAYAHIVQVLVDVILWMFPVMAFSTGMSPLLVIVGTGLLTISYQGLFDLAKQFLDPYDNENYGRGDDPLCVDTLIAETNAGSVRWLYGFEEMPYSAQRVKDGELYEYLLPVRGYTVEELAQMEEERTERERQLEEQRRREDAEEAERLRREAEEADKIEAEGIDDDEAEIRNIEQDDFVRENVNITVVTSNMTAVGSLDGATLDKGSKLTTVDGVDGSDVVALPTDYQVSTAKEERTVHKVTTLKTGKPISLGKAGVVKAPKAEPVPTNMQTSNYLATLGQEANGDGKSSSSPAEGRVESGAFVPEMVDYEMFEDLPWFDEVGPDGKELRLSQQLADEEWEEPDDAGIETKTMTWEEYQERVKELQENAENEARETIEILSAIPGAGDDENLYRVTERRREKKKSPTYDQTRMDGISQLWGLPPEDPSDLEEYEPPEKIDDVDFEGISQLWGGQGSTRPQGRKSDDDNEVVGMTSFAGITELWGSN
jgi:Bestrophin, RFP-TM, chloride channel